MSSTVCQGLQTCLEPGLVEHQAMVLRVVSPKPHLFHRTEPPAAAPAAPIAFSSPNTAEQQCHNESDFTTFASVFSLIQSSKPSYPIQPLRTTSLPTRLTKMSLELCTETLGCETGTDLTNTDFSSHSSCSPNPNSAEPSKLRETAELRRSKTTTMHGKENSQSFPPPLTSISGQSSIHMRPHREGGRLILKAVTVPSANACLQAERSDGRLRLRLVSRNPPPTDAVADGEVEGKMSENESTPTDAETKEEEEEEERGGKSRAVCLGDSRRNTGNEKDEGGEIGIGKYQRPGRCKEGGHGNKGLLNWEPRLVASS